MLTPLGAGPSVSEWTEETWEVKWEGADSWGRVAVGRG